MSPRLTGVLRQWMQHDSGYPANWMPDVIRMLPKQVINVVPAGGGVAAMKEEYGRSLQILLGVCGMVLLIACANVANLLLARGVARRAQTALRLAVGAEQAANRRAGAGGGDPAGDWRAELPDSRSRSWRGVCCSLWHFEARTLSPSAPCHRRLSSRSLLQWRLLTGIIFGSAPAWFATRTDPIEALRGAGRTTSDHSSFTQKALLIVQAALSVVLVAGATMLARSLNKLEHQHFGYQDGGAWWFL